MASGIESSHRGSRGSASAVPGRWRSSCSTPAARAAAAASTVTAPTSGPGRARESRRARQRRPADLQTRPGAATAEAGAPGVLPDRELSHRSDAPAPRRGLSLQRHLRQLPGDRRAAPRARRKPARRHAVELRADVVRRPGRGDRRGTVPMRTGAVAAAVAGIVLGVVLAAPPPARAGQAPADPQDVAGVPAGRFARYCITCHNERLATAGLLLESRRHRAGGPGTPRCGRKVVRKLRTGLMPPAGAPAPRTAATYAALVAHLRRRRSTTRGAGRLEPGLAGADSIASTAPSTPTPCANLLSALEVDGRARCCRPTTPATASTTSATC